jgi:hypothetical protein
MQLPKKAFLVLVLLLLLHHVTGCAHRYSLEHQRSVALYHNDNDSTAALPSLYRFAPLFRVYGFEHAYNRIGRPVAATGDAGGPCVRIDPDSPAVYAMTHPFSTDRGQYTNHVYRIHFSEVPFSLYPFHLTAGKNGGLIVVITTDAGGQPLLVTVVHTCGCYVAIVPTTALPPEAFPENWSGDRRQRIYGETLPALLDFTSHPGSRLLVSIRPAVHRVMDLEVVGATGSPVDSNAVRVSYPLIPIRRLYHLEYEEGEISLYHETGWLGGHVRGSVKPWETLLMSLISLDLFVGADKDYADSSSTGNPFYTSLKPWNRSASDMWHFDRFLHFWGWRL